MGVKESILELVGNTPLLRLKGISPEHRIFAKCDFMNPISLKDRAVLQIIEEAEREGRLDPGQTLIECTSGNTGMAVAMIGAVKGYSVVLVMSEIHSIERRKILKALGAKMPSLLTTYNELGKQTIPIALAKGRIDEHKAKELEALFSEEESHEDNAEK